VSAPANEPDRLLGHSDEADGIDEYDNKLPTWWVGLLFGTVVFAVFYATDYHFISHRSEAGDYDKEVAAAPKPATAAVVITPETVAAGKEIFMTNCIACHGMDLHGGIGPNLTDSEWIHGGKPEEIATTITTGVPAKQMPTWGPILGPQKIALVAAFVHEQGGGQ
jgi:cytochrome c oxidase cbb3-type subunit 3